MSTTGRPSTLPQPLKGLAEAAGGVAQLREVMGGIPSTTLSRWGEKLSKGLPLPRSAFDAVRRAQEALAPKEEK